MRIKCDVHNHTLYSRHAYSTIEENVRAAAEVGLELLGSADHSSAMLFPLHDGMPDMRDYQYFMNYDIWPREWHGVTVLHGCEACIVDLKGHLYGWDMNLEAVNGWGYYGTRNLQAEVFEGCDFVIASVHDDKFCEGASVAQTTAMYIGALENERVIALGHIGRAGVPFEMDAVLTAARDMHKMIEINAESLHRSRFSSICRDIAVRCAELGVTISIASDAHISTRIGRFDELEAMLDEIGFPEELVACRSREAFLAAMRAARPGWEL